MNSSRFVPPETTTLELSEGDWILVKTRLNHGEQLAVYARMYSAGADGSMKVNPWQRRMAWVTAYLLDWSLTDTQHKPVKITGLSPEALAQVLNGLEPESFTEISEAIEGHDAARLAEREAQKKTRTGETGAGAISPSPSEPAGVLTGFVN